MEPQATKGKPPKVGDVQDYWAHPPAEPSARCSWWVGRFKAGFKPNRRISRMGYHPRAEFYGVYIWELINVISPLEDASA